MQVTKSANNVYTVLLVIALLALGATAVYMGMVNNQRFGYAMPFGSQYDEAREAASGFPGRIKSFDRQVDDALTKSTVDSSPADPVEAE
jgi:hypothetical protein